MNVSGHKSVNTLYHYDQAPTLEKKQNMASAIFGSKKDSDIETDFQCMDNIRTTISSNITLNENESVLVEEQEIQGDDPLGFQEFIGFVDVKSVEKYLPLVMESNKRKRKSLIHQPKRPGKVISRL